MNAWMKPLRLTLLGLMSLFLLMSLSSCVTIPMPPVQYMENCAIPEPKAGPITNGELAQLAQRRAFALEHCNLDKAALRAWYDGYEAACGWRCKQRKD